MAIVGLWVTEISNFIFDMIILVNSTIISVTLIMNFLGIVNIEWQWIRFLSGEFSLKLRNSIKNAINYYKCALFVCVSLLLWSMDSSTRFVFYRGKFEPMPSAGSRERYRS